MSFLGIDVGTTRIKAVVYAPDARGVVAEAHAPTPVHQRATGEMHDPEELFGLAVEVGVEALAAAGAARLEGVAVTSMGEEVVLLDAAGAVIGDVLAWYNPRGRELAEPFLDRVGAERLGAVRPDPTFSLFKLLYLAEHRPADLARTARLTGVADYILWRLGDGAGGVDGVVMNTSHASRTGLMHLGRREWDAGLLDAAGLDAGLLPRLVTSGEVVAALGPDAARWLGARAGVPLATGGHDHFCGAYAAGVRQPGGVFISAGTSEALVLLTDRLPVVPAGEPVDAGAFVDDRLWYLHLNVPSGHFFRQWRALLYGEACDDVLYADVGATAVGSHGVRCAIGQRDVVLDLKRVGPDATAGVIMRALLEGLALEALEALERLERLGGHRADEIVVVGQPASRREWLELRAGVFDRTLQVAEPVEASALGAALLAQRAVTGAADDDVIARSPRAPDPDVAARYAELIAAHRKH